MAEASNTESKSTVLTPRHVALGARMVEFSGYSMPLHYAEGIIAEHSWTRSHAGLFDVSHMGPCLLDLIHKSGSVEDDHAAVARLIEPLVSADVVGLKPGQVRYSLLLNEQGGILDDLMIARSGGLPGLLYIIVNSGTKEADFARFSAATAGTATFSRVDDGGLLALQGPEAADAMAAIVPEALSLGFMTYGMFQWQGTRLVISRSGYTGEDGFEILTAAADAHKLWHALLGDPRVRPIGLGARDSLRLEAGLPLYGHDLDETTSPIEAGLGFAVSKRRRELGDFPGAERILHERETGAERERVGLLVEGAPAREGAEITREDGTRVGRITSGGFSPTLGRPIAMGYVPPSLAAKGTRLNAVVRGRSQPALVTDLPFVPHRYVRKQTS